MFGKEIEFSAHEDYFALKEDYPTPIKLNIPEWYKNLEHVFLNQTIKGCMPFLDTLTSGYLFKIPQDLLKYKVLLSCRKQIASSLEEAKSRPTFKYAIVDSKKQQQAEMNELKIKMDAVKAFNKIENSLNDMLDFLAIYENNVTESDNIEFVKSKCFQISQSNPKEFIRIVNDGNKSYTITLLKAHKKGIIRRERDLTYVLPNGQNIGPQSQAISWLQTPENFDQLEIIKSKIK